MKIKTCKKQSYFGVPFVWVHVKYAVIKIIECNKTENNAILWTMKQELWETGWNICLTTGRIIWYRGMLEDTKHCLWATIQTTDWCCSHDKYLEPKNDSAMYDSYDYDSDKQSYFT